MSDEDSPIMDKLYSTPESKEKTRSKFKNLLDDKNMNPIDIQEALDFLNKNDDIEQIQNYNGEIMSIVNNEEASSSIINNHINKNVNIKNAINFLLMRSKISIIF